MNSHLPIRVGRYAKLMTYLRKRPRQARSQVTFVAIVEAAARILVDDGIEQLSTNRIAARAGGEDLRPLTRGLFVATPHVLHAARVERRRAEGRSIPSLEDTLFGTAMIMITLFGEVLIGPIVRAAVGLEDDDEVGRRFRRWMARGTEAYEPSPTPVRTRRRR